LIKFDFHLALRPFFSFPFSHGLQDCKRGEGKNQVSLDRCVIGSSLIEGCLIASGFGLSSMASCLNRFLGGAKKEDAAKNEVVASWACRQN
jgi:hypothetical protein